ncbi:MAG: RHS repeat protein, partial [Thermoguttaceae bacterium]|nr:RHS repeat protein [Thermoguttaceae bacterium]
TNNRTAQATLIVQNTSDKPVDAALLTLTATNDRGERNAMLTLDAAQAQVPYFSTFMPDGFASSISLLTSGASNGVLGPGETLEIPVYWGGWVKPWDSASFEFELSLVEKTETAALDAAEMEKSLRESFTTSRGAAWADDEWALVWASASETFGSRWGDYVSELLDASATAAQNGREANDVYKLTQTIFARALDAFSPYAIPASSVDAAVGSDASSLTFERVYLGDLSKRFLDSPLGRGWRHNWDYALRSNDDGTVYVDTPSGATRAFQPSRRGAAGTILTSTGTDDQGVLLRASDGTFELTELDGTKALFDADGRLTRIVDANGNAVDLTYDGAGLLTRVADGWGHSLTLRYSAKRLVAVVDSNGDETTFERDGAYLTKATGPTGRSVSYRYGDSGGALNALSEIEFADGTTRRFEYDATGRRVGVVNSDGSASRIEWIDATSYKVFDGDVCQGTVYLNDDGAPTKSVDALNRTTVYVYDEDGRLLETTDAQGKTTRYEYDGAGNAVLSVDANGSTLDFEYDAKSFLTKLTDGNGNSSVFEYDAAGNQTLWERVDGTSSSWIYADNGTLTQATDRAGATVSYEYAANGDMTSLQYSTEENAISYEYDERGNAVRIVDANGAVTTLAYDACDRLTKVVYATGRFLEYEYDALGRQISVSDGGDYYVGYAYDAQGRLAQVLDASGTAITVYAYDAQGRLSREEASNGVYTVYAYDALSRLTSKATFTVDGDAISSFAYTYDALDLVRTLTTLDGVWTYAYDATGQITASTFKAAAGSSLANRSYEFAYDAAGNRVWSKIDGVERTCTYDNMNRLLSDGEFEYLYDANGNLTSKTSATEAFSYVWNQRGEILSCVASTGERWDYEYDVFGALIAVTRTDAAGNVERTEYLVDPNAELSSVVSSFDGDGNLVANYIYGLALVGQTDGAGTTAIYASDALGSTAALTGPNGETLNRYAYDQHGAVLAATETVDTPFQFVGTQGVMTGVSSELVQMRARWYDAATGRFVSEDPLGYNAGDANLYRYCGNAVTTAIDPSGLWTFSVGLGVEAGAALGASTSTALVWDGSSLIPQVQTTVGYGAYVGIGADASIQFTATNAKSANNLLGLGIEANASVA